MGRGEKLSPPRARSQLPLEAGQVAAGANEPPGGGGQVARDRDWHGAAYRK